MKPQKNQNPNKKQRKQHLQNQVQRRHEEASRFREPLTGKRARKIAGGYARAEFHPLERQIASEVRGSKKREGDINHWYGQLASEDATSAQKAAEAFKAAEGVTTQRLADASARNDDTLKGLASTDAQFAALTNAPKNAPGLATAASAGAANDRLNVILNQPNTDRAVNAIAAKGPQIASAQLGGIAAHKAETQRRTKMQQDLRSAKKERGSAVPKYMQQLREGDRQYSVELMAFNKEKPYEKAIVQQAKLGLQGKKASANAQVEAAALYSHAKETGSSVQAQIARLQKQGKYRTAEALENQAKIYGKNAGKDKGGYNVREAQGLLGSAGKQFGTPQAAVNYLINRGVKVDVARQAVNKSTGGALGK